MADCNIRNMPDGLMAQMKQEALRQGMSLRAWMIWVLSAQFGKGISNGDDAGEVEGVVPGVARGGMSIPAGEGQVRPSAIGQGAREGSAEAPDCPDCAVPMVRNVQMKRWDCKCGFQRK